MTHQPHTQIAIIGGGISGLWLLNVLGNLGYSVVLLEQKALGQAQTFASQGMIHGGIKYALGGFTTPASESIANMPETWRQCLAGSGPLPLAGVNTLSDAYYLFSDGSLGSKVTAFFGSKSVRGRVTALASSDYPPLFANPQFSGSVYQLQDMVIDTPALVNALAAPYQAHIYQCQAELIRSSTGEVTGIDTGHGILTADCYILSAGAGNAALLANDHQTTITMQRRPLQQVMVKGQLPAAYAHGVSLRTAAKPRVTITTHPCEDGDNVWYLGGQLAEDGVDRSEGAQIDKARRELNDLFPWIDLAAADWATLRVDRAEPANDLQRPDSPFCQRSHNTITCWPIKLTLTPMLADQVCAAIDLKPAGCAAEPLSLSPAKPGKTPWALAF
ncbi:MAG: FAD-dependent oxidoreductase [SAR86 cluster bacterium]|uniref:FAD-dependent oxidoreductase n=1 Tax=SAR86 cluster bacterium TaxID=2030880 RepID=A0A973A8U5_9GAMM|nr:FAD-dependent oxidoreductase [SAR86 cluster bacterium]